MRKLMIDARHIAFMAMPYSYVIVLPTKTVRGEVIGGNLL